MKKNVHYPNPGGNKRILKLLIMSKLIIVFILISSTQLFSKSFSQELVNIDVKNVTVKNALREVEKSSSYHFLYNDNLLKELNKANISLTATNAPLDQVMKKLLGNSDLTYQLSNHMVIITQKEIAVAKILGSVIDADGSPLVGVTIKEKGSNNATTTDVAGIFHITVQSDKAVLVFSYTGYITQELPVLTNGTMKITLKAALSNLNEVVVVGYGTANSKDLTVSVSKVKGKDIANIPVTNLDAALQGKAAGVQVVQASGAPGDESYIRVRGSGSLFGENRPLYVIDGVPMNDIPAGSAPLSSDGQRITAQNDINPNDIESVEILKDAAAASIYGSRGGNGVILITTKKGKSGKAKFNINTYTGIAENRQRLQLLNGQQYVDLITEARANTGQPVDPTIVYTGNNTNWQDAIFRKAPITSLDLSVSGGDKRSSQYISLGYFDQTGTIVGQQHFKRLNGRANFDFKANDNLKIGVNISGTHSKNNRLDNSFSGLGVLTNALVENPNNPIYNPDGSYYNDPLRRWNNPVQIANALRFQSVVDRFIGNLFAEFQITKNFSFRSTAGYDSQSVIDDRYQNVAINNTNASGNAVSFTQGLWLNENTFNYNPVLKGKHKLNMVFGQSFQSAYIRRIGASGNTASTDVIQTVTSFSNRTEASDYRSRFALLSFFGRASYNYADRYLMQLAARTDGSSRFGENKKYGYFPSLSGAWRISNESFFKVKNVINELKLRASIGITGNQSGYGDFPSLATYATGTNYGTQPGVSASSLSNVDLSWEQTVQTNFGIDFSLFNSRINVTVDAYQKNSNKLVFRLNLPYTSGFGLTNGANVGKMTNKGLDILINTDNIRGHAFTWNTSFNMSFNRNKIDELPQLIIGDPSSSDFIEGLPSAFGSTAPNSIYRVGQSVGSFFGYRNLGINPATGNYIYQDTNGDGRITSADRVIIGNALPKFTGALANTFNYKNFDLSASVYWSYGNQVYNQTRAVLERMAGYTNGNVNTLNRWTPANPNADVPRAAFNDPLPANSIANGEMSQRWLEDGSYLKLQNVTLGYNLPTSLMKKLGMGSTRVYVSGQNLGYITKYTGMNPESQNQSLKNSQLGIDYAVQPIPRTIMIGASVNF